METLADQIRSRAASRDVRPLAGALATIERGDDRGIEADGGRIVTLPATAGGGRRRAVSDSKPAAGPV